MIVFKEYLFIYLFYEYFYAKLIFNEINIYANLFIYVLSKF